MAGRNKSNDPHEHSAETENVKPLRAEISYPGDEISTDVGHAEISLPIDRSTEDKGHVELSCLAETDSSAAATARAGTKSPFSAGSRLLNRFRVLRYVARGGMGEVYEVEDEITGRRMALKTVIPAVARDPQMVEQLKEEINNARDVTHRNVCRVFEVFEDTTNSPPGYFLTMEFLEGETLADALHREGPMTPHRLLPIARQMAAGLDAVHQAGIVHQDFKTSNVMLVGSGDNQRVVVTDFGLAVNSRATSVAGVSGGTPAYMAPEQVHPESKGTLDKRADIYAFGVVLYELLTGHFPIEGKTAKEVMDRKRREDAVSPSRYCPELPTHWVRTIRRCLERDPALRFASLDEVIAALEQRAEKRKRRRMLIATSAIVLTATAAIGGAILRRYMVTHRVPTVAMVGLTNRSAASYDWLGTELSEALSANLAGSSDLKTVPQDEVAMVKGEFPVAAGNSVERENLSGFRQAVAADYLVIGDYQVVGSQVSFDLKLQDSNGELVGKPIHEEGSESNYQALVANAADALRHNLGSTLLSEAEAEEAANIYPKDAEARHLYFDALSKMRALNAVGALELLQKAVRLEDRNVALHAAEAEALALQKRFGEAKLEARRAQTLTQGAQLPNEYVMLIEARADELNHNWPDAVQRLDALYRLSRDKLRYGLLLADTEVHAMRSEDALRVLAELARLPKPAADDPRILITQAEAFSLNGNYVSEIQSAKKALQAARARKWRLMEAWADLELCWAEQRTQNDASLAACQQAQDIFASVGDPVNAAVVLNNVANWQTARGQFAEAKQAYEDVLRITDKAEDQVDSAGAHLNLAGTLWQLNDSQGCREHLESALKLAATTGDKHDEARARLILADVYRATTGIREAIEEVDKARSVANEIGDRDTEGYAWTNLILYRKDAGDLAGALTAANQAVAVRSALDDRSGVATAKEFVADVYFEKGDLVHARQLYQQSLAAHDESEKPKLAELWLSIAEVEFEAGDLNAAGENCSKAVDEYRAEKDGDSEADALALLTKIMIARKDPASATNLLHRIDALNSQDKEVQANVTEARADWLVANGQPDEAITLLTKARTEEDGVTYARLKQRLALAQARYAAHQHSQAFAEFAAIRRDAQKGGFELLAKEATPAR